MDCGRDRKKLKWFHLVSKERYANRESGMRSGSDVDSINLGGFLCAVPTD